MDKLAVARSQLMTAIERHLDSRDPISVHTLAGAAREIIEVLCRKIGVEPFTSHIQKTFPHKTSKEIYSILNLYRNAFKHADNDDVEIIQQFSEEKNDYLIFVAIEDSMRLKGSSPVVFQAVQTWFHAIHEDRLADEVDRGPFRRLFPGINQMSRSDQKKFCKAKISEALLDYALLADPRTEAL